MKINVSVLNYLERIFLSRLYHFSAWWNAFNW